MAIDYKTIVYALSPSVSGDFAYFSSSNALDSLQFNNGANWSVQTGTITPTNTSGVNLLNISAINYGAIGAVWYFGKTEKFDTLAFQFTGNTDNTSARTTTWEFWNGSSWEAMAQSGTSQRIGVPTGQMDFENNSQYIFKINPQVFNTWSTTTVNGSSSLYFIRVTIGGSALTTASLQSVSAFNHYEKFGNYRFDNILTTLDDAAFTDRTLEGRSAVTNAFTFTANTTAARLYIGSTQNDIAGIRWSLGTGGATGNGVWEYWNGSAWTAIPEWVYGTLTTNQDDRERLLTTNVTTIIFTNLSDWAATTVNGINRYWIRFRVTVVYTTQPQFTILVPLKAIDLTRTIYIPEQTNRSFSSVFAKLHVYNPINATHSKITMRGRLGSNNYEFLSVGEALNPAGTFQSIGGKIFSTTANDGAFTDETGDASDSGTNDITVTNSINANIYFCYPNENIWKQNEHIIQINSNGAFTGGVVAWEYWNGATWTSFSPLFIQIDKDLNFTASGSKNIIIPILPNWTATTVNSFTGYIFRRRITSTYSATSTWTNIAISYPGFNSTGYTNGGENIAHSFHVDLTNMFNSQFTGASQTIDLHFAMENFTSFLGDFPIINAELYITYSAETQATQIKTVYIPLDSSSSVLTSSLQSIGTNQIPQLSTYLPEASKVIRNFYIVMTGQEILNTNISTEYRMKVGSSQERFTGAFTSTAFTSNNIKCVYVDDSINTSTTHDLQMAVSSRHNGFRNWAMYAVVTYEYNAASTTRTIQSLILPFETASTTLPQDDPTYAENIRKNFFIEEPGTIDNANVGCYISFGDVDSVNIAVREKSESNFTTVTWSAPTLTNGCFRYGWKLPSQSFVRGKNEIGVDMYIPYISSPDCYYISGYFIVNYHSDVATQGIEKHSKTVFLLHTVQRINQFRNYSLNTLTTPLSAWFANNIGIHGEMLNISSSNSTYSQDIRYILENPNNTNKKAVFGAGGLITEANEVKFGDVITEDRDVIKKYPGDLHDHRGVDLYNGGRFMTEYGISTVIGASYFVIAQHEITFTVSGNVIGYSGNGGGLTVNFYDHITAEKLFSVQTAIGGSFSGIWYDNTREVVCDVYDPVLDKYVESAPGIAGTDTFDLDFTTGGTGGGTTSYAFIS